VEIKEVTYSRLNAKNKARIDQACEEFQTRPAVMYQSVVSTRCTKHWRRLVTISNPMVEIAMLPGDVKMRVRKIHLDNDNEIVV